MNILPLKAAGLTDGEIKVYLALLEIGSSTIGPILEKSGIIPILFHQPWNRKKHPFIEIETWQELGKLMKL